MIKAIKNKQTELTVSLGMILLLIIIASVLMYFLEHDAQPKSFENLYTSLWWGIDKYLTSTGGEDINPITPAGKFLSGLIAILGVGMFALPAGIIASGFIEEIENDKLLKKLTELELKLENAFSVEYLAPVIKIKRELNLSHLPRKWLSISDIKYKMGISESSVLQVCEFSKKFKITNVNLDGINTVGLEYINLNRTYGQCINRGSKLTIVNLYPFTQPFFGHFGFAISELLQANYISNEKFGQSTLLEEYRLNLINNKNYFEESISENTLKEIKNDISSIMPENGVCIFMVNAGNNDYLMQFNIGAEKGDTSFENGIYFSDLKKLNQYFNNAKLLSEKYGKSIAKHATVGKPEEDHIANFIHKETKNDVLLLHINVSILKANMVEYYQCISDFASIFKDETI
ncbi:ion transporter [Flavobacterium sp.]|jgi:CRISPR/Cas system-associated endoribonuclease Cas2|uniref:ion transporter n=1 Tax=Flavobacterium sp. TaxID=239 RepID=UPI0037C03858